MLRVSRFFSSVAKRTPFQAGREAAQVALKNPGVEGVVLVSTVGKLYYARSAKLWARCDGAFYKGKPFVLFFKQPALRQLVEGVKPSYMEAERKDFREMLISAKEDPDGYDDEDVRAFMQGYAKEYLDSMRVPQVEGEETKIRSQTSTLKKIRMTS